jgi:large subunit ribosomal protein L31
MKKSIHPQYYQDAVAVCACGSTFTTGSTRKQLRTDMCSKCHPFFTGEQRIVDTAGQVERFMKRLEHKAPAAPAK